jgi:hypoxanthine phosphoribosyltransferase
MSEPSPFPVPRVLIPADEVQARIRDLAAEITAQYRGTELLVCVGVLKGAVFFMADLLKNLDLPIAVDFFQASSYHGRSSPGEVRIRKDIDISVRGRDVLLIEDIVDTGFTLRTILDLFRFRGARSVKLCSLLDKKSKREIEVPIHFSGFDVEDRFVVGYGLDYDEKWRNLPFIGCFPESEILPPEET